MILETTGLGKDYGKLTALHALDLAVGPGEIFGLLGPNGAGKTTAISMIAGVVAPSRGAARVAGYDVLSQRKPARRALGLVPQEVAVYEPLSARENLRFFGSMYGLHGGELADRIRWALDVAGLAERADEPVTRFSGGMKRRLNLVAALLHRPALLILDEPTVGVDPHSRNHIFEMIRGLSRDGTSVVYTSHYMEEVESLCGRVAILDRGRLIAIDTVRALLASQGPPQLEIELSGDVAAAAGAAAGIADVSRDGDRLRLPRPADLGAVVRAVEHAGATVIAIRTLEVTLEGVFLAMTGHSLRDGAA